VIVNVNAALAVVASYTLGTDPPCYTLNSRIGAVAELRAMAVRDWAVRVLDAASTERRAFRTRPTEAIPGDQFEPFVTTEVLWLEATGLWLPRQTWEGQTSDAARCAAADAVFPTLDADVRASLGEKPCSTV
jgi:hypothetical protein